MNMDQFTAEIKTPVLMAGVAETLTMSSREIAELLESRHDKVKQSIERLSEKGVITFTPVGEKSSGGRPGTIYHVNKRDSYVVVAQLSPEFTARLVDRWQELEAQATPAILTGPQLMAAALIEAQATLKTQAAQIEDMREDVAALDKLASADGSLSITEAAKGLGVRPKDLFSWLSQNGWIYKRPGGSAWLGYSSKCNQGLLEHKTTTVYRADGSEKVTEQCRVTAKGMVRLAKVVPGVAKEVK